MPGINKYNMNTSAQKNEQEQLFDELIAVKHLYKTREKEWRRHPVDNPEFRKIQVELTGLKRRIRDIEKCISRYGDSFFDVYDSELILPLSELDIINLRDEINEVRHSLETMVK
jgi:hypothetical protein